MYIGLIAAMFTLLSVILICVFNHKTKKIFSSYYFYGIVSIIGLVYFIWARWSVDLKTWIDAGASNASSITHSKVLLLDMCPFLTVFLPIMLIIDRQRKWVPSIAYFAIVGGGITVFGQIMFEKIGPGGINATWWEYLFLNKLYFIMHYYIFILGFIIILNSSSLNWKKVIVAHGYAIAYFTYVTIIVFSLGVTTNATGIVEHDWSSGGQYHVVGEIFNLPWPWQPIVCFTLVWIWILLMMAIRNILVVDPNYIDPQHINIPFFRDRYLMFYSKMQDKFSKKVKTTTNEQ